jgi:hypothetical protein
MSSLTGTYIDNFKKIINLKSKGFKKSILAFKESVKKNNFEITGSFFTEIVSKNQNLPLFHQAVKKNNLAAIKFMFEITNDNMNVDEVANNLTPLQIAVKQEFVDIVTFLISKGADPFLKFEAHLIEPIFSNCTNAFECAIVINNTELLCELMEKNPTITQLRNTLNFLNYKVSMKSAKVYHTLLSTQTALELTKCEQRNLIETAYLMNNLSGFGVFVVAFDLQELESFDCDLPEKDKSHITCSHSTQDIQSFIKSRWSCWGGSTQEYLRYAYPNDPSFAPPSYPIFWPSSPHF